MGRTAVIPRHRPMEMVRIRSIHPSSGRFSTVDERVVLDSIMKRVAVVFASSSVDGHARTRTSLSY